MIIIDASTLAKYILKEANWLDVETYLFLDLCSIDHIVKEVSNAIWKHTILHKRFSIKEYSAAINALKRVVSDIITIESEVKYLDRAADIALKYKLPIYDSLYIAQALKYGELLTSDKEQAKVAKVLNIKVHYVE